MDRYMPSEIARLVLGYLKITDCEKSWRIFLDESQDLKEYNQLLLAGKEYPTTLLGRTLVDILNEYYTLTVKSNLCQNKHAKELQFHTDKEGSNENAQKNANNEGNRMQSTLNRSASDRSPFVTPKKPCARSLFYFKSPKRFTIANSESSNDLLEVTNCVAETNKTHSIASHSCAKDYCDGIVSRKETNKQTDVALCSVITTNSSLCISSPSVANSSALERAHICNSTTTSLAKNCVTITPNLESASICDTANVDLTLSAPNIDVSKFHLAQSNGSQCPRNKNKCFDVHSEKVDQNTKGMGCAAKTAFETQCNGTESDDVAENQRISTSVGFLTPKNSKEPPPYYRAPATNSPRIELSLERSLVPSFTTPVKQFFLADEEFKSPKRKSQIPRRRLLSEASPLLKHGLDPDLNISTICLSDDDFWEMLNYPPLVEKIAENINNVIGSIEDDPEGKQHDKERLQQPVECLAPQDVTIPPAVVKDILFRTEADPVFEEYVNYFSEKHIPCREEQILHKDHSGPVFQKSPLHVRNTAEASSQLAVAQTASMLSDVDKMPPSTSLQVHRSPENVSLIKQLQSVCKSPSKKTKPRKQDCIKVCNAASGNNMLVTTLSDSANCVTLFTNSSPAQVTQQNSCDIKQKLDSCATEEKLSDSSVCLINHSAEESSELLTYDVHGHGKPITSTNKSRSCKLQIEKVCKSTNTPHNARNLKSNSVTLPSIVPHNPDQQKHLGNEVSSLSDDGNLKSVSAAPKIIPSPHPSVCKQADVDCNYEMIVCPAEINGLHQQDLHVTSIAEDSESSMVFFVPQNASELTSVSNNSQALLIVHATKNIENGVHYINGCPPAPFREIQALNVSDNQLIATGSPLVPEIQKSSSGKHELSVINPANNTNLIPISANFTGQLQNSMYMTASMFNSASPVVQEIGTEIPYITISPDNLSFTCTNNLPSAERKSKFHSSGNKGKQRKTKPKCQEEIDVDSYIADIKRDIRETKRSKKKTIQTKKKKSPIKIVRKNLFPSESSEKPQAIKRKEKRNVSNLSAYKEPDTSPNENAILLSISEAPHVRNCVSKCVPKDTIENNIQCSPKLNSLILSAKRLYDINKMENTHVKALDFGNKDPPSKTSNKICSTKGKKKVASSKTKVSINKVTQSPLEKTNLHERKGKCSSPKTRESPCEQLRKNSSHQKKVLIVEASEQNSKSVEDISSQKNWGTHNSFQTTTISHKKVNLKPSEEAWQKSKSNFKKTKNCKAFIPQNAKEAESSFKNQSTSKNDNSPTTSLSHIIFPSEVEGRCIRPERNISIVEASKPKSNCVKYISSEPNGRTHNSYQTSISPCNKKKLKPSQESRQNFCYKKIGKHKIHASQNIDEVEGLFEAPTQSALQDSSGSITDFLNISPLKVKKAGRNRRCALRKKKAISLAEENQCPSDVVLANASETMNSSNDLILIGTNEKCIVSLQSCLSEGQIASDINEENLCKNLVSSPHKETITSSCKRLQVSPCRGLEASPSRGPEASPSRGPEASPSRGPEASPSRGPEASPSRGPEASPSRGPEASPGRGPEASPGRGPEASPGRGPEASPSRGPEASPSREPEASPGRGPEASPGRGPEASPGRGPEASPGRGPEASLSRGPEASSCKGLETSLSTPGGGVESQLGKEMEACIGKELGAFSDEASSRKRLEASPGKEMGASLGAPCDGVENGGGKEPGAFSCEEPKSTPGKELLAVSSKNVKVDLHNEEICPGEKEVTSFCIEAEATPGEEDMEINLHDEVEANFDEKEVEINLHKKCGVSSAKNVKSSLSANQYEKLVLSPCENFVSIPRKKVSCQIPLFPNTCKLQSAKSDKEHSLDLLPKKRNKSKMIITQRGYDVPSPNASHIDFHRGDDNPNSVPLHNYNASDFTLKSSTPQYQGVHSHIVNLKRDCFYSKNDIFDKHQTHLDKSPCSNDQMARDLNKSKEINISDREVAALDLSMCSRDSDKYNIQQCSNIRTTLISGIDPSLNAVSHEVLSNKKLVSGKRKKETPYCKKVNKAQPGKCCKKKCNNSICDNNIPAGVKLPSKWGKGHLSVYSNAISNLVLKKRNARAKRFGVGYLEANGKPSQLFSKNKSCKRKRSVLKRPKPVLGAKNYYSDTAPLHNVSKPDRKNETSLSKEATLISCEVSAEKMKEPPPRKIAPCLGNQSEMVDAVDSIRKTDVAEKSKKCEISMEASTTIESYEDTDELMQAIAFLEENEVGSSYEEPLCKDCPEAAYEVEVGLSPKESTSLHVDTSSLFTVASSKKRRAKPRKKDIKRHAPDNLIKQMQIENFLGMVGYD